MFKPTIVKPLSILAIFLCVIGFLFCIVRVRELNFSLFFGILSWGILLFASYIGFKLSSYNLHEDEYKKVAIRVYLIILLFFVFFFSGVILGLFFSVLILSTLWGLKSNYDDWIDVEIKTSEKDTNDSNP